MRIIELMLENVMVWIVIFMLAIFVPITINNMYSVYWDAQMALHNCSVIEEIK